MIRTDLRVPASLIGSGLAGMLVGVQSRINGGLSQQLENGYLAAVVSFGSGLLVMSALVLLVPTARNGLRRLVREVRSGAYPVWGLFGGTFGGLFVLSQGLVATVIGLALFTVGIVAGQVLGGLLIDRIGLGPGGRLNPSPQRIVGTALAVVAVIVSVTGGLQTSSSALLVLVPFVAGIGMAWQSAVNGLVRSAAKSAITATFVNFVVGTAVLAAAAAVAVAMQGWPAHWPSEPWNYSGGLIGVVFIAAATIFVRVTGVLLLSMSNVAGQLIASVLLEAGAPLAGGVTTAMLAGTAIALLAVVIASVPKRRGSAR